ncbi:MAG: hypothetical protein KatS3mg082_1958 [Nitrospiraceae bacterium]|nr:MAG: hypothetical protein KatS3mg082_1958 [Nitrospiraceae bacterium]
MAQAVFVHEGASIDYTPAADVAAGDVVVQGDLVGVAKLDIKAGKLGALAVEGVFDFAKATGVGTAIAAGAIVYWDDTANQCHDVPQATSRSASASRQPATTMRPSA